MLFSTTVQKVIYALLSVILLFLSFLSGRLSVRIEEQKKPKPIKVIEDLHAPGTLEDMLELIEKDHSQSCPEVQDQEANLVGAALEKGPYVASKSSSSKKFHRSDSGTAKMIKSENKVYFASKEEAIAAGYTPGSSVE